jgi:hypothetical protein
MATSTQATTATTTIEIAVKKVQADDGGWEWSIEPMNEEANKARYGDNYRVFKEKWDYRHPKKPAPDPINGHHFPIVFKVGETLKFSCPDGFEFAIGTKKNADVDEVQDAPDNPFGWPPGSEPVPVAAGASFSALVKSEGTGPGPREQAFYKFYGWVKENGSRVDVDPDGYCGG